MGPVTERDAALGAVLGSSALLKVPRTSEALRGHNNSQDATGISWHIIKINTVYSNAYE